MNDNLTMQLSMQNLLYFLFARDVAVRAPSTAAASTGAWPRERTSWAVPTSLGRAACCSQRRGPAPSTRISGSMT